MTLPSIVLSKAHAGVVFMLVVGPDALKVAVALAEANCCGTFVMGNNSARWSSFCLIPRVVTKRSKSFLESVI